MTLRNKPICHAIGSVLATCFVRTSPCCRLAVRSSHNRQNTSNRRTRSACCRTPVLQQHRSPSANILRCLRIGLAWQTPAVRSRHSPSRTMSLLKLVLSSTAQRSCQHALPALWSVLGSSSSSSLAASLQGVQQQQGVTPAAALPQQPAGLSSSSSRGFHVSRAAFSANQVRSADVQLTYRWFVQPSSPKPMGGVVKS